MLLGLPTAVGTKVVTRYSKMLPRNQKNKTYISLFVVLSFVCFSLFFFLFLSFFYVCVFPRITISFLFVFCFSSESDNKRTIMYQYPVENFLWCAFCCSFFPCLSRGRAGLVGYEGQGVSRGRFGHGGGRGEGVTALLGLRLSLSVR